MKKRPAKKYVIGIDEVGRGALAGPVVVAAAMVPAGRFRALKDSKKLSPWQREAWYAYFKNSGEVRFAVARVYPRGIERLNISGAANRAALRAFTRLMRNTGAGARSAQVFLDGGLFLGSRAAQKSHAPRALTVIKGDEKIPAVAAASIVAKVTRDRFMVRLARRWPAYSFEVHKGYGTKIHRAAIAKAGPCEAHRLTFLKKRPIIRG
ncbi:MAG: ribonuclease HII [Candidatus Pacebacteria bacterium]|nr:ribonuclease HII [Candidatus Paceibacterota bacterium]